MLYSTLPNDPYGWFDFIAGSAIGLYGSQNVRQRNYDCFSHTWNFTLSFAEYGKHFDGKFKNDALPIVDLGLKVLMDAYAGWRMIYTCVKQVKYSQLVPWEKEFIASGPVNSYGVLQPPKEKPVCNEIGITANE